MASSDNLMTMEQPWGFRPTFADAWVSDIFTKETDTLTKALQRSIAAASSDGGDFSLVESLFAKPDVAPLQTPTASGCSESEAAAAAAAAVVAVSRPRRGVPPSGGGRVAKRKSRASKRSTTTFITADAANFRQMVQQVTGVRFAGMGGGLAAVPALKPEPYRAIERLQMGGGLPTFDTSAFFVEGSAAEQPNAPATVSAGGNGPDFESYCSFPTLESYVID